MKKIIYSLVIMIAAGSLFTSCVENTEPQGIRDLREAKADYLASLSKLREADAELVKAKAALKQAEAATEQAVAAYNQAIAEAKQIENEIQKARNEKEAEELKAQIDSIIAKAEQDAVDAQKTLAKKQDELEKYLRELAAKSFGLTREEEQAIKTKTATLNIAYRNYNQKLNAYNIAAFQLWDAEYNVSAGVEGYETAESYKDSIAKYEEKIADANEDIASLEALKEHPQAVKDSLDVLDAQIAAIEEQIFLSQSDKVLYESTPEFADAKKEFAKRVSDFQADSLKGGKDFKYVDKDGKAIKYPLTNGKGLDQAFKTYVNEAIKDKKEKTASAYGIVVDAKAENIEVGKIGSVDASKKQLDSAQALLKEIINALDRHLVVVNDSVEAKKYEGLVKAANEAKKAYINDRDTLEKGLAAYAPYKAANDTVKMYQDTVKKAQADSLAAEKKLKADSVTIVTDAKTLAQNYHDAIKNFSDQAALFVVKDAREKDTTGFLSAVNALGSTQAAYLNLQDSVLVEKKAKLGTQEVTYTEYVSFSSLTKATFKAIYDAGSDQHFAKVLAAANCNTAEGGISNKKIAENVGPQEKKYIGEYDGKAFVYKVTENDTVNWLKTKFNFANQTFEKDEAAVEAAKDAVTKAKEKLAAKVELATKAKDDFGVVYNRFWGITSVSNGADPFPLCESLKKWTDSTFFSPENCVTFEHGEDIETILPNNTLKIVLDRVDGKSNEYSTGVKDVNASSIFKNNELTEFAAYILAAQYADEASNYKFLEEQFENIKAQVAAIKKDVDAAYAAWEEANKGLAAVKARFYGYKKDGKTLNIPDVTALVEENVNVTDGKWAFGGYLLKWAEELAPEYPAIVKEATAKVDEIREDQANLIRYRFTLDMIFTIYSDFFENPDYAAWNVEGIIKLLDEDIKTLKADIKVYENRIEALNKSVAECEAGYSNAEIKVNYWKSVLAQTERALEQAEEALARAQKEYDEVIAAYGVKDAE